MINYWCKWAIAIYGWKYLWSWKNGEIYKTLMGLLNSEKCNQESLLDFLNINKDDIIKAKWSSEKYCPAYIVATDHKTKNIVVSIRGTMSVKDIVTDINNRNIEFMDGKVHGGMKLAANNIYQEIIGPLINIMRDSNYDSYGLRFVGHSLGGAVAGIMTHIFLDSHKNMITKTKTYCFGCPPVFSEELAEKWNNIIITIVNNKDIIPRLYIGDQLYLPGLILHCVKTSSGISCIGRDKEYFIAESLISTSFQEHFPNKYFDITQIVS